MHKKRYVLVTILLIIALGFFLSKSDLSAAQTQRGCCFRQTSDLFCRTVPDQITYEQCCPDGNCDASEYDPISPCDQTETCNQLGCCIESCSEDIHSNCPPPNQFVYFNEDVYSCSMIEIVPNPCEVGCCAFSTDNQVQTCEDSVNRIECTAEEYFQYDNALFFPNEACIDVCHIGETPQTGNLTGFLYGPGSSIITNLNREVRIADKAIIPSSQDGSFNIPNIPVGEHTVHAYAEGYTPESIPVQINENLASNIIITLSYASDDVAIIEGYVIDFTTGDPLEGTRIYTDAVDTISYAGDDGYYIITNVPAGLTQFTASETGYDSQTKSHYVIANFPNRLDFELLATSSSELCGNYELNDGEECDPSVSGGAPCADYCLNDCTCAQSCIDMSGMCCIFDYQCTSQGEEYLSQPLDCNQGISGTSPGCCPTSCEPIPPCIDGTTSNHPVSDTDMSSSSGPYCYCGDEYINTASADGYCCSGNYQEQMCVPGGLIQGYVKNETGHPMESAILRFTSTQQYTATTDSEGFYTIGDVDPGSYNVTITKTLYETLRQSGIPVNTHTITQKNFTLTRMDTSCMYGVPAPVLNASWTSGELLLNLGWTQECESNVKEYYLFKNGAPIIRLDPTARHYTDVDVSWDTDYSYYLLVYSWNLDENISNIIAVSPGQSICEEMAEDEEFCLDDIDDPNPEASVKRIRAKCNEQNHAAAWNGTDFSELGDCTLALNNEHAFCLAKDSITWCQEAYGDCTSLGEFFNLFGLYYDISYDGQTCEYNFTSIPPTQKYCYYDVSETTVDTCHECEAGMDCYDYLSEQACIEDNCVAGDGNECGWAQFTEFFGELGKGICYQEDYQGTEMCGLCSPSNPPYENTHCTPELCNLLGKCYSDEDQTSCISCQDTSECEQFQDRTSCEGSPRQPFEVPGSCGSSPDNIESDDTCGLGRCKWQGSDSEGFCFKDGDDDNQRDCPEDDTSCKADVIPSRTVLTNPPMYIISSGINLTFSLDFDADNTYYCINSSETGVCCPDDEMEYECTDGEDGQCIAQLSIPNSLYPLEDFEGNIDLNFYTIDINKNVGDIDTKSIFVDTIIPEIDLLYTIENTTGSQYTSNLSINISVSEHAYCTDTLRRGTDTNYQNLYLTEILTGLPFENIYSGLDDGTYVYSINCTDDYGNLASVTEILRIDRVHLIFNESPNNVTLPFQPEIRLFLKTYGEKDFCRYKQTSPSSGSWRNFNPGSVGLGISDGEGHYYYGDFLYDLASATYAFDIECRDQANGQGTLLDMSNILFTVDGLPPTTSALIESNSYISPLNESQFYRNPIVIFNCTDKPQGPPLEFGCSETYYCFDYGQCEPATEYNGPFSFNEPSGDYQLCYFSADLAGNTESTRCSLLRTDTDGPEVTLYAIPPTSSEMVYVRGSFSDQNVIDVWIKVQQRHGVSSYFELADINYQDMTFSKQVELFNGENLITATAIDAANNRGTDTTIAILDQEGPDLSQPRIRNDLGQEITDSTSRGAEFGYPINFSVTVRDTNFTHELSNLTLMIENASNSTPYIHIEIEMASIDPITRIIAEGTYSVEYLPYVHSIIPIGEYKAIFYAKDRLGNPNTIEAFFFVNDTKMADVSITYPVHGQIYSSHQMNVTGIYSEPSVEAINVTVVATGNSSTVSATYNTSMFEALTPLYPGSNFIQAEIFDTMGNTGFDYVVILNDLVPPNFTSISIKDTFDDNDPDSDMEFEYNYPLFFRAQVNDNKYSHNITEAKLRIVCQNLSQGEIIEDTLYPETPLLSYEEGRVYESDMYLTESLPYLDVYFPDRVDITSITLDSCQDCVSYITDDSKNWLVTPWANTSEPLEIGSYLMTITSRKVLLNGSLGPEVQHLVPFTYTTAFPFPENMSEGTLLYFTPLFDPDDVGTYIVDSTSETDTDCIFDRQFTLTKVIDEVDYVNRTYYDFYYEPEIVGGSALLTSSYYNAIFTASDQYGNTAEEYVLFRIIDSTPPKFNITIDSEHTNSQGQSKVGRDRNYYVNLIADKPLSDIEYFKYSVFDPETSIYTTKHLTYVEGSGNNYTFLLRIYNNDYFDDLEGNNTEFFISATNIDGIAGTQEDIVNGRYFEIDTKAPDIILTPSVEDISYTTQFDGRITGTTDPTEAGNEINLNMSLISGRVTRPSDIQHYDFSTVSAPLSLPLAQTSLYESAGQGATMLVLNNDMRSSFISGRYIEFSKKTFNPDTLERYIITSSSFDPDTQTTSIQISPGLVSAVPFDSELEVYTEPVPTSWFEFFLEFSAGNNSLYLYAVDELGNIGSPLLKQFINDNVPPEIYDLRPYAGSVLNGHQLRITATIEDLFSPVIRPDIRMMLNGQILTCANQLFCQQESAKKWNITYDPIVWSDGIYTVNLSALDWMDNYAEEIWQFEVDHTVPDTPEIILLDGNLFEDRWYSSDITPTFHIEFTNESYAYIDDVQLVDHPASVIYDRINDWTFHANPWGEAPLDTAQYLMRVEASELFEGEQTRSGVYFQGFIIDTILPEIYLDEIGRTNRLQDFPVTGSYYDGFMDQFDTVSVYGDVQATDADLDGPFFSATTSFLDQMTEGQRIISATAHDKAGNENTDTIYVEVDTTLPDVEITDIHPVDNSLVVKEGTEPPFNYTLNSTPVTIEGVTDMDTTLLINITSSEGFILYTGEVYTEPYGTKLKFTLTDVMLPHGISDLKSLHKVEAIAVDEAGNRAITSANIRLDMAGPEIISINPQSTADDTPDLEVITDEPATCTITYTPASGTESVQVLSSSFTRVHHTTLEQLKSKEGKETATQLRFDCKDQFGYESEEYEYIVVDFKDPKIFEWDLSISTYELVHETENDKYYIMFATDTTSVDILASEPVMCKYDTMLLPYGEMRNDFTNSASGYDVTDTTHPITLENATNTTFYIQCKDRAGRLSQTRLLTVFLWIDYPIHIYETEPLKYTNDLTPSLSGVTKRETECTVERVEYDSIFAYIFDFFDRIFSESGTMNTTFRGEVYLHQTYISGDDNSPTQADLEDGSTYSFNMTCTDPSGQYESGSSVITFTVDTTLEVPFIYSPQQGFVTDETMIIVNGETEPLSTVNFYVNSIRQNPEPLFTQDGTFFYEVVLQEGSNEIRVEVTDKALNTETASVSGTYERIGPIVDYVDPDYGSKIDSVEAISGKLYSQASLDILATDITLERIISSGPSDTPPYTSSYTSHEIGGSVDELSEDKFVFTPEAPLADGRYKVTVVPVDVLGRRGEGYVSIFDIDDNSAELFLRSPYDGQWPYRDLIITAPEAQFEGNLYSNYPISQSKVYVSGVPTSVQLDEGDFSIVKPLELEGRNVFKIYAKDEYDHETMVIGHVFRDTKGPTLLCIGFNCE